MKETDIVFLTIRAEIAIIPLSGGRYATVDSADVATVRQYKWYAHRPARHISFYARSTGKKVPLHRYLLGFPNCPIDHINHNGLDNRRKNLRLASHSQNSCNRRSPKSKYFGVCFLKKYNKFQAAIGLHRKSNYLGVFDTAEDAARAYDAAAREMHGEFATLNFGGVTK